MAEPLPDDLIARIAASAAKEALKHYETRSRDDASNIALAAAKEAVRETHAELFALLGYNIADFRDINKLRGNLEFLNSFHATTDKVGARALLASVTMLVGAFGLVIWAGFKVMTGK